MKSKDIRSIGGLNAYDGSVNLGACFHGGSGHATFVNVSRDAYILCQENQDLLKHT